MILSPQIKATLNEYWGRLKSGQMVPYREDRRFAVSTAVGKKTTSSDGSVENGIIRSRAQENAISTGLTPTIRTSRNAKPTTRPKLSWRYWKTPVLFGAGLCILQILVAIVRFSSREGWNPAILFAIPAILFGLAMFFLCGLMVGLLVQHLLKGCTGAWRTALMVGVALATPFAVLFSLFGGLLGPPVVLIGALVPYLLLVGLPVLIRKFWLRFVRPCRAEKRP